MMEEEMINSWLRNNIVPLERGDEGLLYRASATLEDGTIIPCVAFQHPDKHLTLAKRRLEQTLGTPEFAQLVRIFTLPDAVVSLEYIVSVAESPFAWPREILDQIHGETIMGWTCFVVTMGDGAHFNFGTTWDDEFFDLPSGYTWRDIVEIRSGQVVDPSGQIRPFVEEDLDLFFYRERIFFTCYSDGL